MNRVQIEQQLAALRTTERGVLTQLAGGDITPELKEQAATIKAQIDELDNKLAVMAEAQARLEKFTPTVPGASSGGARVHDNGEDKPFNGIGDYLFAVRTSNPTNLSQADPRLRKLAIGQSNAIDSEGGFFVGTQIGSEIWRYVFGPSSIAAKCLPLNISGANNAFEIPVLEETSRATGSRNGGARAFWTPEAGTIANSIVRVGKVRIELEKLAALMYATSENLSDAAQLGSLLTGFASDEMAFTLDDAIVSGDGAGKPLGILGSAALRTTAAEGGQTAGTVNFANVTNMWGDVLPQAKTRGAWYIHSTVFPQLMRMASAATSAAETVFLPPGGVSAAPYGSLFGRPIYEIEQANPLGQVGDIFFADFNAYGLARKGGVDVAESMHVRFLTDEMAFRLTMRVNGRPVPKAAITNAKGSATRSAFVALAAR